ncbi:uncharacterized protein LOC142138982 isoform X2 [Mixophyes fleayi]|uniref:uncharacterized protein LOC142138982 isoform X2 n=1 Tax=Mixophyes fleayi TaxID=3061075 RepID=UPI003F4E3DCC
MKILILCSFLIQATSGYLFGPSEVTGALEGSVTISCYYNTISANIHGRKFWCKMHKSNCDTIISTTSFIAQGHMNRTHLQDFRGNFMINMTSLQHKDAGTYRCGIGINNGGFYYTVIVAVSEGNKIPSSSEIIIATPRDTLNIHCPVQQESYNRSMYRCKTGSTACDTIINSSGYVHKNFWGRVLLEDDTNTTNFKILVNNLKMMDSGLYRCGTGTFEERSEWKDVHVYVINNPDKRRNRVSKTVTESADESLVAQCQVPDNFGPDSLIYWCRWNETGCLRLIDSNGFVQDGFHSRINLKAGNITNMTYTVTMTHLKLEDTGIFWCVITDGQKLHTSSIEVHILVTTTVFYLSAASRGQPSNITTTATTYSDLPPTTGTTAEPYSRTSSRGHTSNRSSATISSTPLSTTDSRQDIGRTTNKNHSPGNIGYYTSSSTARHSSAAFLPSNTTEQETTVRSYSRASSRGQTSSGSSATISSPLTTADSRQETTAGQCSRASSRGQTSGGSSATFSSTPLTTTSSPEYTSAGLPPIDGGQEHTTMLHLRTASRGQTSRASRVTFTTSSPPSITHVQGTTAEPYFRTSSRGQTSNRSSATISSTPLSTTDSRHEETTLQNIRTSSRGHTSRRSSATFATFSSTPLSTTDSRQGRDLSGNIIPGTTYRSTTVHNYMVTRFNQRRSQVTNLPGDSTTPIQSIPYKSHYNSQNVSANRLNNLLLIVIPVLLISCIIVITAVVLIVINIRKKRVTNKPNNHEENLAMIDGGAAREGNVEENESTLIRVANQEDISGETEV